MVPAFIVADVSSIGFGKPAEIVGTKAGSCKKLDESTTGAGIDSTDVNFRVVVVIDEGKTFNQLPDLSFSSDAKLGSMSQMILPMHTGVILLPA